MTEITRLLSDLVRLPSVNPMGRSSLPEAVTDEYRVTDYLEQFFRTLGVPSERQDVAPRRQNLVARHNVPGARRTLVFEAHQDTVPTDQMTIDPFAAGVADGKLYGRGACDIKGGMTAMLTAFARVVRERPRGSASLVFAATVDEEHTGLGVKRLVRDGLQADMAVVAEPTQLQIVDAHKGAVRGHVLTRGRSCHSSRPEQGSNAIYRMADVLRALEEYADELRQVSPDPRLGPPSLSVGRIEGGTSVNTVPDWCRIEIDRRVLPREDPRAAWEEMCEYLRQRLGADFPVEAAAPWSAGVGLSPRGAEELTARLGRAIDEVCGRHEVLAMPYGTDAATIARAGVPAVIFGPGDIARAHTADEWVPLDEVEQAAEILFRLACQE